MTDQDATVTTNPGDASTAFLDRVYFGDADSEADRVSATVAPAIDGAEGASARAIGRPNDEAQAPSSTPEIIPARGLETIDTTDRGDARFDVGDGSHTITARGNFHEERYAAVYASDGFESGESVEVTIESMEGVDSWQRAGLLIANDITDAGGSVGDIALSVNKKGPELYWDADGSGRLELGGDEYTRTGETPEFPTTLRLVREDQTFTAFYSTDGGSSYTELGSTTIDQAAPLQDVGIYTVGGEPSPEEAATATFSGFGFNERLTPPSPGVTVTLACDPEEETLLTVKLWGGDPSSTKLRYDPIRQATTRAHVDSPQQSGRFYYETMAIEPEETADAEDVSITLTAANDESHVYAAYTHVENFYAPPEDEIQGSAPEPPEPTPVDFDRLEERALTAFENKVDTLKEQQRYGQDFWDAVDAGETEARTYGLWGVGDRKAGAKIRSFIKAYQHPDSKHHGDEELIQRALAGFDGHCRYQGYRGTLEIFWGRTPWIGGPDRSGPGGGLPGFMASRLGRALLELRPILEERPELLEAQIDNDGDGEETVPRGEAYSQFWADYLWENMLPRFGIAQKTWNQIIVNGRSMVAANEILKWLAPENAAPEDIIRDQMRHKAGIMPVDDDLMDFVLELQVRNEGEYGKVPGSVEKNGRYYESKHWHWSHTRHYQQLSPKGIGIEFGYDPGYSFEMSKWPPLLETANDHKLYDQFQTYLDGMAHMIYPTLTQTGHRWQGVGAIGARNPASPWGGFNFYGWAWAAVERVHPAAERIVREQLRYSDADDLPDYVEGYVGGYDFLDLIPRLRDWYENEEPTDHRLLQEGDEPAAWTDEMVGTAVVNDADGTLYLSHLGRAYDMDYHRITPEYRAFGYAKTDYPVGSHVESCVIGPYEIAMNRSNTVDVRTPGGPRVYLPVVDGDGVVDITTGESIDPGRDQLIDPDDSIVLDGRRDADSGTAEPTPTLAETTVDSTTRTKRWTWEVPEGCQEADFLTLPIDHSQQTRRVTSYYDDAVSLGTRQHANQVGSFYRPDRVDDENPVTVRTDKGVDLAVENVDGSSNRIVSESPSAELSELEGTGLLPTFDSYDAWRAEAEGLANADLSTDSALFVSVDSETAVTDPDPITFTLPLEAPVTRILFTHESSWDRSGLRTVLETADGRQLWRGTKPNEIPTPNNRAVASQTDELVHLADKHVEDALHFRVSNPVASDDMDDRWYRELTDGATMTTGESTTIGEDWFRRIRNVRIEYADGTAAYPHR
jgi:hypothetical protein